MNSRICIELTAPSTPSAQSGQKPPSDLVGYRTDPSGTKLIVESVIPVAQWDTAMHNRFFQIVLRTLHTIDQKNAHYTKSSSASRAQTTLVKASNPDQARRSHRSAPRSSRATRSSSVPPAESPRSPAQTSNRTQEIPKIRNHSPLPPNPSSIPNTFNQYTSPVVSPPPLPPKEVHQRSRSVSAASSAPWGLLSGSPTSPNDSKPRPRRGSLQSTFFRKSPPQGSVHPQPQRRRQILFYHKGQPYYDFTNFSPHTVIYDGKLYPTSEHLFQAFKFLGRQPNIAHYIRKCPSPSEALAQARAYNKYVRKDWFDVNVSKMDDTLFHKFSQHRELRDLLYSTGDAELIEDSDTDSFWGVGKDGNGRNELGKALERLRDRFFVNMPQSASSPTRKHHFWQ